MLSEKPRRSKRRPHAESAPTDDWERMQAELAAAQAAPPGLLEHAPPIDGARWVWTTPGSDKRLQVSTSDGERHTVVTAEGEVNRQNREELRAALQAAIAAGREGMNGTRRGSLVAVDLRRAAFADDWGWVMLTDVHLRLSAIGQRLFIILEPHGAAHRQMERLGLGILLTTLDSRRALNRVR